MYILTWRTAEYSHQLASGCLIADDASCIISNRWQGRRRAAMWLEAKPRRFHHRALRQEIYSRKRLTTCFCGNHWNMIAWIQEDCLGETYKAANWREVKITKSIWIHFAKVLWPGKSNFAHRISKNWKQTNLLWNNHVFQTTYKSLYHRSCVRMMNREIARSICASYLFCQRARSRTTKQDNMQKPI